MGHKQSNEDGVIKPNVKGVGDTKVVSEIIQFPPRREHETSPKDRNWVKV